jgi:hypothetical protein
MRQGERIAQAQWRNIEEPQRNQATPIVAGILVFPSINENARIPAELFARPQAGVRAPGRRLNIVRRMNTKPYLLLPRA